MVNNNPHVFIVRKWIVRARGGRVDQGEHVVVARVHFVNVDEVNTSKANECTAFLSANLPVVNYCCFGVDACGDLLKRESAGYRVRIGIIVNENAESFDRFKNLMKSCLLYTSPSPRD